MNRSSGFFWWRCRSCGEILRSWVAAERHADQVHGGGRIELGWEGR